MKTNPNVNLINGVKIILFQLGNLKKSESLLSTNEIEEKLNKFVLSEDNKIEEQYEISDNLDDNAVEDNNVNQLEIETSE